MCNPMSAEDVDKLRQACTSDRIIAVTVADTPVT